MSLFMFDNEMFGLYVLPMLTFTHSSKFADDFFVCNWKLYEAFYNEDKIFTDLFDQRRSTTKKGPVLCFPCVLCKDRKAANEFAANDEIEDVNNYLKGPGMNMAQGLVLQHYSSQPAEETDEGIEDFGLYSNAGDLDEEFQIQSSSRKCTSAGHFVNTDSITRFARAMIQSKEDKEMYVSYVQQFIQDLLTKRGTTVGEGCIQGFDTMIARNCEHITARSKKRSIYF